MDSETREMLQQILNRLDKIENRLEAVEENTEITRSATNSLVEWAEVTGGFPIKKAE